MDVMDVVIHSSPNKRKAVVVKLWHILGVLCKNTHFYVLDILKMNRFFNCGIIVAANVRKRSAA
jgi:hypothetical protein